jgi:hypothetical protein
VINEIEIKKHSFGWGIGVLSLVFRTYPATSGSSSAQVLQSESHNEEIRSSGRAHGAGG